jgi:membrane protein implicated in regulation of membrane protease activity
MWEAIAQYSSVSIFLIIGALGLAFLVISLFFGEFFEVIDIGTDPDAGDEGGGVFSLKVMSVFMTAFGGVSALSVYQGFSVLPSIAFGVAGGFVMAALVYYFGRLLYGQQSSSHIDTADLVGCKAEVIVGIPKGGSGQVRCLFGESMVEKIARSRDGSPIPQHAAVLIEEVFGESVIVSPWSSAPEGRSLFSPSIEP